MLCRRRFTLVTTVALLLASVAIMLLLSQTYTAKEYRHTKRRSSDRDFYLPLTQDLIPVLDDFKTKRQPFSFARHGPPLALYSYATQSFARPALRLAESSFGMSSSFVSGISCNRLLNGDKEEQNKAKDMTLKTEHAWNVIETNKNCQEFKRKFGYITEPLTQDEESFPIAYSIIMYRDEEQVEHLLRAIYRPQNFYCIHVDSKSSPEIKRSMAVLSSCFDNVFISSRSVSVVWGTFTVLEPELICMEDLWTRSKTWKYFINLTGQEFPLRTNWELVQILQAYNGANDIEGTIKRAPKERYEAVGPPPHGIVPVKGGVHIVASRSLIDFILHRSVAADILDWSRKVEIPDEIFFSTLNHNPSLRIKGTYKGEPESDDKGKPFLARFKNWSEDWACKGKYVHDICVFGVGDLPLLSTREELFANKFIWGFETLGQYCLAELLYNRTVDEYYGILKFNTSYYSSRDFVHNQIR